MLQFTGPATTCTAIFKLVSTSGSGSTWARVWRYGNIVETFAVKINTETVNVVATDEIMIIAVLQATRIDHRREDFRMVLITGIPLQGSFTAIIV